MKRFISGILTLLLIFTFIPFTGVANAISIYEPLLSIESTDIPSVDAGSSKTIYFTLKNTGYQAKDVIVTPIFEPPFTTNSLTSSINIGDINSNSKTSVKLNINTEASATPGNYPVRIQVKYNYYSFSETENGSTNPVIQQGTYEETIYIRVSGKSSSPRLLISKVSTSPEIINPGQDVKLHINFENKGSIEAKDVTVKLDGLDNSAGFYMASGSDVGYVKRVPGDSVSAIVFDLKAANNVKRGSHELEVTFSHKDVEEKQKIYLTVGGSGSQSSNLVMENISYPSTGIGVNKNYELKFDLRNNGTVNASNIIVNVESSDPSAVVPKSTSIIKINNLAAEETSSLKFVFSPTEDAITRNYPLNITVEYEDEFSDSENKNYINQYVGINVISPKEGDDDPIKSKPRLIIDQYSFQPTLVKAGENFDMNLSFYNTNSLKTVKNIKIFLTVDEKTDPNSPSAGGSVFTPVNSSNTFYIDSISPKGKVNKKITMFTVPDAQAKTYTMTANFVYEDNDGEEYTDTELIGVPVIQQSKLEVGELGYYPDSHVGQPNYINLEFYNTGKVTLYNMMVKLEGDFQTEGGSHYVGNFNSGSSDYFEGAVIPNAPGELEGYVVFTYEDSTGQEQEIREPFTLNVMEEMPMDDMPWDDFPMDEEEPSGIKGILKSKLFWGIIIALILVIVGLVVYKKKKQEKEYSLDE